MQAEKIAIVGMGSWGSTMASLVTPHVPSVVAWAHSIETVNSINRDHKNPRYFSDKILPENIFATSNINDAIKNADAVILAVPSAHLRKICSKINISNIPFLILTKGIEKNTNMLMDNVVKDELGENAITAVLSGPNLAAEIMAGKPAAAVIASSSEDVAKYFQSITHSHKFRTYITEDVKGVEICGATKNIVAIAAGIASGLNMGDNTQSLIITRGLAEISRLCVAMGGDALTCLGLAGVGDLSATCASSHSRNRSFGVALTKGITLQEYEAQTHMVVEGAEAVYAAHALANENDIEAPITNAIFNLLYKNSSIETEINALLNRPSKVEFY